jgi:hypothetical protein
MTQPVTVPDPQRVGGLAWARDLSAAGLAPPDSRLAARPKPHAAHSRSR